MVDVRPIQMTPHPWAESRLPIGASVRILNGVECVVWEYGKDVPPPLSTPRTYVSGVTTNALQQFVRLASGNAGDVIAFGKRWGTLELCHHHRPYTHQKRATHQARIDGGFDAALQTRGICASFPSEPVYAWIGYARQFRAALRIVA